MLGSSVGRYEMADGTLPTRPPERGLDGKSGSWPSIGDESVPPPSEWATEKARNVALVADAKKSDLNRRRSLSTVDAGSESDDGPLSSITEESSQPGLERVGGSLSDSLASLEVSDQLLVRLHRSVEELADMERRFEEKTHASAGRAQASWRGHACRRSQQRQSAGATTVQRTWRGTQTRREVRAACSPPSAQSPLPANVCAREAAIEAAEVQATARDKVVATRAPVVSVASAPLRANDGEAFALQGLIATVGDQSARRAAVEAKTRSQRAVFRASAAAAAPLRAPAAAAARSEPEAAEIQKVEAAAAAHPEVVKARALVNAEQSVEFVATLATFDVEAFDAAARLEFEAGVARALGVGRDNVGVVGARAGSCVVDARVAVADPAAAAATADALADPSLALVDAARFGPCRVSGVTIGPCQVSGVNALHLAAAAARETRVAVAARAPLIRVASAPLGPKDGETATLEGPRDTIADQTARRAVVEAKTRSHRAVFVEAKTRSYRAVFRLRGGNEEADGEPNATERPYVESGAAEKSGLELAPPRIDERRAARSRRSMSRHHHSLPVLDELAPLPEAETPHAPAFDAPAPDWAEPSASESPAPAWEARAPTPHGDSSSLDDCCEDSFPDPVVLLEDEGASDHRTRGFLSSMFGSCLCDCEVSMPDAHQRGASCSISLASPPNLCATTHDEFDALSLSV